MATIVTTEEFLRERFLGKSPETTAAEFRREETKAFGKLASGVLLFAGLVGLAAAATRPRTEDEENG